MKLTQRQLFLIKEIVSKAQYDKLTGKKTIYPNDYLFYNLNKRTFRMLERICMEHDIYIEKLPDKISVIGTDNLFKKYNELKIEISGLVDEDKIKALEKEMISVKQQIVLAYMEVMYRLINEEFPYLIKEQDSDDIYQIGYEILTWSIDKYDFTKAMTFSAYIKRILIHRLAEKIWAEKRGMKRHEARELIIGMSGHDFESIDEIDVDEIRTKAIVSEQGINYLLLKGNNSCEVSLDFLQDDYFMVGNFEDDLLDKIEREDILILLDTLPDIQKEIIKLYYGFVDGKKHSHEEIAHILGYHNRERIRQIKEDALTTLSMKIYSNIYDSDTFSDGLLKERMGRLGKLSINKRKDELMDTIINSFSKDRIVTIIKEIPSIYRDVLVLYYGLETGICYSIKEISEMLEIKFDVVKDRKREGVKRIAKELNQSKNLSHTDELVKKYVRRKRYDKKMKHD